MSSNDKRIMFGLCAALIGSSACGDEAAKPDHETDATLAVKDLVTQELDALHQAAVEIGEAAPEPDADGWNADDDAEAVEQMREAWGDARDAYERVEGALAVLFPEIDVSIDERYDGFVEAGPDDDAFDAEGATGMHQIERILWADSHPATVVAFESALPNYAPAAFPATEAEATAFKAELVQRLQDDVQDMMDQFEPLALEPATAFRGVMGSLEEQVEKVSLAATAEDESRYAQRTLADMRANLEGGRAVYDLFRPWVKDAAGAELDGEIIEGFERIGTAYAALDGDAIPAVPADFDPEQPSDAALATDYGELWQLLTEESDLNAKGSLLDVMQEAATAMGIPQL